LRSICLLSGNNKVDGEQQRAVWWRSAAATYCAGKLSAGEALT
jgi:hypothetical protein